MESMEYPRAAADELDDDDEFVPGPQDSENEADDDPEEDFEDDEEDDEDEIDDEDEVEDRP